MPYTKINLFTIFANIIFALKNKNQINHITGSIHYVAIFLPSKSTILTIHDCGMIHSSRGIKKILIKYLWFKIPVHKLNYITAISEFTKKEIIDFTGCREDKIRVINNPINKRFLFTSKTFNSICPNLLIFCYFPCKNTLRILEAIKALNVSITIIGEMNAEIKKLLIKNNIKYQNFFKLSDEEIVERYQKCDMLIFPSYYEGFGLPILEAQSIGRVVITSNIEPMKSIAADSAHLVDPISVDSIRSGIVKVINDDVYRESLIKKSQINIKRYNVETIALQYEDIYNEILKKK